MTHELSLSDYIDHGRATVREVRSTEPLWAARRSEGYYRFDRLARRNLGPLDCDCDACRGLERPPMLSAVSKTAQDEGQLSLPGVG